MRCAPEAAAQGPKDRPAATAEQTGDLQSRIRMGFFSRRVWQVSQSSSFFGSK